MSETSTDAPAPPYDPQGAIALLDKWMADKSGYDEKTWPQLEALLQEQGCMAPPVGTEAAAKAGGAILTGDGPHAVTVEHDGRRATLELTIDDTTLVVGAYEDDGPRLLGKTRFEEPT